MIKTKISGVEIRLDFTFFAVIAMFATLDSTGFALMSLAACLIHESGHLLAMLISRKKPKSLIFRGGGISIISISGVQSFFVLISGSAMNIAIFLAIYLTSEKDSLNPVMFAILNLITGIFNLLPIGCLDGSRLLDMFTPPEFTNAARLLKAIVFLAVIVAIGAAIWLGGVNFTIAAVMIYLLCVDFFEKLSKNA